MSLPNKPHVKSRSPNPNRTIKSNRLFTDLILSGRRVACEVAGCECMAKDELEIHHIMPVSIRPIHSNDNLVILCKTHHALVERYYWWKRSELLPDTARRIKQIARLFRARAVKPEQLEDFQQETKALWAVFNGHEKLTNYLWWKALYQKSKQWAAKQETVRSVEPGDAIIEDPWFRERTACQVFRPLLVEQMAVLS